MSKGYTAQSLKQTLYKLGKGYSKIAQAIAQTRWVYGFNGVDSYIDTGGYTYSGDFWVEVKAQLPTQLPAGNQAFFGGSGGGSPNSGAFTAFLNSSQGFISVQIPTTSGTRYDLSTPVATYMGSAITLRLERSAGVWSMLINGAVVDTFDSNSFGVVDMEVTSIARWSTTIYYNGAVYDYKDSLGNNLPINDRTFGVGAPIANSATALGSDLPTNDYSDPFWSGSFDQSSSGDGFFVTSGGGFGPRTIVDTFITGGNTYLIHANNLSSGVTVNIRTTELGVNPVLTSNGVAVFTVPSGDTGCQLYIRAGSAGTHTANISARQANGYATGVNLLESGWQEINI